MKIKTPLYEALSAVAGMSGEPAPDYIKFITERESHNNIIIRTTYMMLGDRVAYQTDITAPKYPDIVGHIITMTARIEQIYASHGIFARGTYKETSDSQLFRVAIKSY